MITIHWAVLLAIILVSALITTVLCTVSGHDIRLNFRGGIGRLERELNDSRLAALERTVVTLQRMVVERENTLRREARSRNETRLKSAEASEIPDMPDRTPRDTIV